MDERDFTLTTVETKSQRFYFLRRRVKGESANLNRSHARDLKRAYRQFYRPQVTTATVTTTVLHVWLKENLFNWRKETQC